MKYIILLLLLFCTAQIHSDVINDGSGHKWEVIDSDFDSSSITVHVHNELGIFITTHSNVSLVMYKNNKYYVSNKDSILGVYPRSYAVTFVRK